MKRFLVSKADAGDFHNGKIAWDVLHEAGSHAQGAPDEIDMSQCVMVRPYALACLAALGASTSCVTTLVLPQNDACRDHLVRMGLPQWFANGDIGFQSPRETNVVIKQLQDRPLSTADEIVDTLLLHHGVSSGEAPILKNHIDELLLNALTHAESPIGCIVAGQVFPTTQWMEIAVVDFGQTIRRHLIQNPKHAQTPSDEAAIRLAVMEYVTGTVGKNKWNEANSGSGLTLLREYCEQGHAEMAILSGTALITFSQEAPDHRVFHGGFGGTLINVRFMLG